METLRRKPVPTLHMEVVRMPTAGKLGKLAAVRPHVLSDLAVYAKGKIPDPPPSVDYYTAVGSNWGMLGNDTLGDCTIAGAAHAVMAWNKEVKSTLPAPDQAAVVKQYEAITGGADKGCVEANVLTLWQQQGLWGDNRIDAFAPVPVGDLVGLHQAVAFYGGAYIGVTLPRSAVDQFKQNAPWTVVPRSPVEGGHCIVLVGYDPSFAYAVTWGAVVQLTYPWLATYMDESWAIISEEFAQAHGGPELDLAALQADLGQLKVENQQPLSAH